MKPEHKQKIISSVVRKSTAQLTQDLLEKRKEVKKQKLRLSIVQTVLQRERDTVAIIENIIAVRAIKKWYQLARKAKYATSTTVLEQKVIKKMLVQIASFILAKQVTRDIHDLGSTECISLRIVDNTIIINDEKRSFAYAEKYYYRVVLHITCTNNTLTITKATMRSSGKSLDTDLSDSNKKLIKGEDVYKKII